MRFTEIFEELKGYIIACTLCFFLLPILQLFMPAQAGMVLTVCFVTNVIVIDVTSFICGYRNFRWYYPLLVIFLYVFASIVEIKFYPTGDFMFITVVFYLIASYISLAIGKIIGTIRNRNKGL